MVKIIHRESLAPGAETPAAGAQSLEGNDVGVSLDTLRPGQTGTVVRVEAGPALKLHLMELGFVSGSPIAFLMSTPFGDPNIYALRGTSIALRKSEAKCIRVRI
jgi:ferrous iron transport protein A